MLILRCEIFCGSSEDAEEDEDDEEEADDEDHETSVEETAPVFYDNSHDLSYYRFVSSIRDVFRPDEKRWGESPGRGELFGESWRCRIIPPRFLTESRKRQHNWVA